MDDHHQHYKIDLDSHEVDVVVKANYSIASVVEQTTTTQTTTAIYKNLVSLYFL
jgi:hypothetical protein